jgi:hypothetical protein
MIDERQGAGWRTAGRALGNGAVGSWPVDGDGRRVETTGTEGRAGRPPRTCPARPDEAESWIVTASVAARPIRNGMGLS